MAFQGDSIYWVEVEKVVPNPFQPRREFDQNKLQELADSIRMYGVLQPLTVTRKEVAREDGTFYTEYELIAGERRLRASKLAGTAQVPVIIREGEQSEQEKLELAIIENLQREDLNAVDRAIAFKQLAESFGLAHAQVAQKVGRSREYVSNSIRLLGLPEHMLESLKVGDMMEGHARTLLMLSDRPEEQEVVYKEVLLKKLSVREVERIVRKIATDKVRKHHPNELDSNLIEFEKQFTETLGTRVQIQKTDFGGKLTIDYFSVEDLEAILQRVRDEEAQAADEQLTAAVADKIQSHTPLEITQQKPAYSPVPVSERPATPSNPTPPPVATPVPVPIVQESKNDTQAGSYDREDLTEQKPDFSVKQTAATEPQNPAPPSDLPVSAPTVQPDTVERPAPTPIAEEAPRAVQQPADLPVPPRNHIAQVAPTRRFHQTPVPPPVVPAAPTPTEDQHTATKEPVKQSPETLQQPADNVETETQPKNQEKLETPNAPDESDMYSIKNFGV